LIEIEKDKKVTLVSQNVKEIKKDSQLSFILEYKVEKTDKHTIKVECDYKSQYFQDKIAEQLQKN